MEDDLFSAPRIHFCICSCKDSFVFGFFLNPTFSFYFCSNLPEGRRKENISISLDLVPKIYT